jgi:hypothetical protein
MANVKKGQTVPSPEWWKHLRKLKRLFWKRQRRADKAAFRRRQDDM